MSVLTFVHSDCIACDLAVTSKKQLFQEMADMLVKSAHVTHKIKVRDILSAAMERERLGSTGVGSGVALPHARIDGINQIHAAFARLSTPLEYDAIDDRPVDLVMFLLAPSDAEGAHLRALAQVSRRLRREDVRAQLRSAPNWESLYTILTDKPVADAA